MQPITAIGKTAVVVFLKQYSLQPLCELHVGRALAHWGNSSKKGNMMALFQKRK